MSTPHEPDDDRPTESEQDARWREIVENFGDRVPLEEPEPEPLPASRPDAGDLAGDLAGDDRELSPTPDPEDRFVPPPPPPLPRPAPIRLLAWLGLFGVPLVVLVCVVLGVPLPRWLGLLLMAWFVGGFVFLVASMRPDGRDGYDDGAVL